MEHRPSAPGLGMRDVIGAWIVCLAVAAVSFGYPLRPATRVPSASGAMTRRASAGALPEICIRTPRQGRTEFANISGSP